MKKITALAMTAPLAVSLALPMTASAAPTYDSPRDIQIAKRFVKRSFYGVSYSSQRSICRLFDTRTVYVVRRLGRSTYQHTPNSVSLREAQKGVIYALSQVC